MIDTKVVWDKVLFSDILRTKENAIPKRDGAGWAKDQEPDKDASLKQAKALLIAAGIGNSGQAMVSAGLKPCGEPCKCTAGRSKHLEDAAADLNSSDLETLTSKLTAAKAGDIDTYLKKFGLQRPLVDHPTSPEKWHVESTE